MKRVILFDAKYLLYRQHFAHVSLVDEDGFPTGGMFGFWKEVLRMQAQWHQYSMVFCWDNRRVDKREQAKTGYKANRETTEETIRVHKQEAILKPLLTDMGFWSCEVQGLEADDLIAVLVRNWPGQKDLVIYSGDRDLHQLVGDGVRVLWPRKTKRRDGARPDDLLLTPREVWKEFGVTPESVPELRAMAGDMGDNLKGLPGIGLKKALDLFRAGARPSRPWEEQPFPVRQILYDLSPEWLRIRQEYQIMKLAGQGEFLKFTSEQQDKLKKLINVVSAAPERRKPEGKHTAWLDFIGRYAMEELFKVRNRVWLIP